MDLKGNLSEYIKNNIVKKNTRIATIPLCKDRITG
jgi:hypothetical protein